MNRTKIGAMGVAGLAAMALLASMIWLWRDRLPIAPGGLHEQAYRGNLRKVSELLASELTVDIEIKGGVYGGTTPLIWAARGGAMEVVEYLLDNAAAIDKTDDAHRTALHHSVLRRNHDVAHLLLKSGANPHKKDELGRTPIMYAARGDPRSLTFLLESGADCSVTDEHGNTALHEAIQFGSVECAEILIVAGADVNAPNGTEATPLILAVNTKTPDRTVIELLFAKDADPNRFDVVGMSPLLYALSKRNYQLMQLLLHLGADVDDGGPSAFIPIHQAAARGDQRALQVLLNHGCLVDARDNLGEPGLHKAVRAGHVSAVEMLIDAGADATETSADGTNAIDLARRHGAEVAEELLRALESGGD